MRASRWKGSGSAGAVGAWGAGTHWAGYWPGRGFCAGGWYGGGIVFMPPFCINKWPNRLDIWDDLFAFGGADRGGPFGRCPPDGPTGNVKPMTTARLLAAPRSRLRRVVSQSWRIGLGLVLGLILLALTFGEYSPDTAPDVDALGAVIALDMLCGLVALVLYPLRHRFPVPVVAVLVLLAGPSTSAAGFAILGVVSLSHPAQAARDSWRFRAVPCRRLCGGTPGGRRAAA